MITELYVDGFKSLKRFRLKLDKGLNVLIGPNGAGKSNICQALGVIAAAAQDEISDYLLSLGGVATAFTKECVSKELTQRPKRMRFECKGIAVGTLPKRKDRVQYRYALTLSLNGTLRITQETLHISVYTAENEKTAVPVLRAARSSAGQARRSAKPERAKLFVINKDLAGPLSSTLEDEKGEQSVDLHGPLDSILLAVPMLAYFGYLVTRDMAFSRAWNIDPHVARRSSDVLEPSEMGPDGKYLANVIHSMIQNQKSHLEELQDFMGHVMPQFESLDLENPDNAQDSVTRSFSVRHQNGLTCPAASLSDGTIKALALLVGVFTKPGSMSIIEEPENYLHPWAAVSLVTFLRDHYADGVCVLTTHSETILNSVKPAEIIVVGNVDGRTDGKRLKSKKWLSEAIRKSGFGPGYHYLAGSIGGTPQ